MGNTSSKKIVKTAQGQSKVDNGICPSLDQPKDAGIEATPFEPEANTIDIEQQRQLQDQLGLLNSERAKNTVLREENLELRDQIKNVNTKLQAAESQNGALAEEINLLGQQLTYLKRGLTKGDAAYLTLKNGELHLEKAALVLQHAKELATLRKNYNRMRGHLGRIIGNQRQKIREYELK